MNAVLNNSFGFGGTNASLVMKRGRLTCSAPDALPPSVRVLLALLGVGYFAGGWYSSGNLTRGYRFHRACGIDLDRSGAKAGRAKVISIDADAFLLRAKVFGGGDPIKAGEFLLPEGASASRMLDIFQHGDVISRSITIPEGMPSRFWSMNA